ncbi:hypothetical protein M885DRAFT_625992 [Pelagophyceae sp. CCMP2097]|nr:hypothetical protein M885DRAFT_625992 [Pelagophyceae sp. CCMP2097]
MAPLTALFLGLPLVLCARPKESELTAAYSYKEYLLDFKKPAPADYAFHKNLFETQLKKVIAHNADAAATYKRGVNAFTDAAAAPKGLAHQRRTGLLGAKRSALDIDAAEDLPDRVDWREHGIVSAVKDQGGCGSCWAFAVTATMESHIAKETGSLYNLSPQELVSCMANPDECGGTGGCQGATAELGFDYYVRNGGAVQEYQMGYTSYYGSNGECYIKNVTSHRDSGPDPPAITTGVASITDFEKLPSNDYLALLNAVAKVGPVAISVDASWHDYEAGVFTSESYDATIDHAVVLVGYGVDAGVPYWLVRNSWSPNWGEHGYIRLFRHVADTPCGVDIRPLDGTGCKGGPANMTVCGTSGILSDSAFPKGGHLL